MGALAPGNVVWEQPWRLLAFFFLHNGVLHYAMNMWALLSFKRVEQLFGSRNYCIIYVLGGLASGLGALLTFLLLPGTPYVVGASGALYAIATAEFTKELRDRPAPSWYGWVLIVLVWMLFVCLGNPFGHISGAIVGALIGFFFLQRMLHRG